MRSKRTKPYQRKKVFNPLIDLFTKEETIVNDKTPDEHNTIHERVRAPFGMTKEDLNKKLELVSLESVVSGKKDVPRKPRKTVSVDYNIPYEKRSQMIKDFLALVGKAYVFLGESAKSLAHVMGITQTSAGRYVRGLGSVSITTIEETTPKLKYLLGMRSDSVYEAEPTQPVPVVSMVFNEEERNKLITLRDSTLGNIKYHEDGMRRVEYYEEEVLKNQAKNRENRNMHTNGLRLMKLKLEGIEQQLKLLK